MVFDVDNTEEHDDAADDDDDGNEDGRRCSRSKKPKVGKFELDSAVCKLIKLDEQNHKLWDDVMPFAEQGQQVTLLS